MIVLSCFRNTAGTQRALSLFEEGGKRKEEGEYSKHRIVLRMAEGGVDLGHFCRKERAAPELCQV